MVLTELEEGVPQDRPPGARGNPSFGHMQGRSGSRRGGGRFSSPGCRWRAWALRLSWLEGMHANGTVRGKLARLGLASRFHHILDSFEENVEKPDPRFFEIAIRRSGADRSTTIHIGDMYHVDIVGARAAGLQAVLLDSAGLHAGRDCDRVASLGEFADRLCASAVPSSEF